MRSDYTCPYCGKKVNPRNDDSAWAKSRRLMGSQTLNYAHLHCIEAMMPRNKKEVPHDEGR